MTEAFTWNLPAFAVAGIAVLYIARTLGRGHRLPSKEERRSRSLETYFRFPVDGRRRN